MKKSYITTIVTTYAYDAAGNRRETTNALGHVSRVLAHDAHGRALMMRDSDDLPERAAGGLCAEPGGSTAEYQHDL